MASDTRTGVLHPDWTDSVVLDIFRATYDGACGNCRAPIGKGDPVKYTSEDAGTRLLIGENCCGDVDLELIPAGTLDAFGVFASTEDFDDQLSVPAPMVMPRRRTARDMCRTCFQIPASNGVCGCA